MGKVYEEMSGTAFSGFTIVTIFKGIRFAYTIWNILAFLVINTSTWKPIL